MFVTDAKPKAEPAAPYSAFGSYLWIALPLRRIYKFLLRNAITSETLLKVEINFLPLCRKFTLGEGKNDMKS
jgi:hypothetical protein